MATEDRATVVAPTELGDLSRLQAKIERLHSLVVVTAGLAEEAKQDFDTLQDRIEERRRREALEEQVARERADQESEKGEPEK